jgi:hypothetical protein
MVSVDDGHVVRDAEVKRRCDVSERAPAPADELGGPRACTGIAGDGSDEDTTKNRPPAAARERQAADGPKLSARMGAVRVRQRGRILTMSIW